MTATPARGSGAVARRRPRRCNACADAPPMCASMPGVPRGPRRPRPGPARPACPRGDRDALPGKRTADRHDPEPVPVRVDERADQRRNGSCSRAKACRRHDLDRALQLVHLALELADLLRGLRAHPRRLPLIDSGLADPLAQRLRAHPQPPGHRGDRRVLRRIAPACSWTIRIALALVPWSYLTGMNVPSFPG